MKHFFCVAFMIVLSIGGLFLTGCNEQERKDLNILLNGIAGAVSQSPLFQKNVSFYERYRWKAENYFNDRKVIALCKAIEAQDLIEINRLIADGADANALGRDNMTPLLWAFPTKNLAVFTRILEAGADPNVQITSGFGVILGDETKIWAGKSVMELAALTVAPGYFEAVMRHGGDPNLVSKEAGVPNTPLHSIASEWDPRVPAKAKIDRIAHAKLLLNAGADINAVSFKGTPITVAVIYGQFDLALFLLEAGADWESVPETLDLVSTKGRHYSRIPPRFLHVVSEREGKKIEGKKSESFDKLVLLLEAKGVDFDKVREEREQHIYGKGSANF